MLYFERWKIVSIIAICVSGLLFTLPNMMSRQMLDGLPDWLPKNQLVLGLDLQGGAHLLLELDMDQVYADRLDSIRDEVQLQLRPRDRSSGQKLLRYTRGAAENAVQVIITDPDDMAEAERRVRTLVNPVSSGVLGTGGPDLNVEVTDGNRITVRLTGEEIVYQANRALEQSIEVLTRRINAFGTLEPSIQRSGADRILVQFPGAGQDEIATLKDLLIGAAKMTFNMVCTDVSQADIAANKVKISCKVVPSTDDYVPAYAVEKRAIVTGEDLAGATVTIDENGQPAVGFRFDGPGGKRFADATAANVGRPFAIILDGIVISAPVIRTAILGGSGIITGNFTFKEANELSIQLRSGALPADLTIVEERTVGPDMGADAVAAGKLAAMAGLILVVLFMGFYYRRFGIYSDIALIINLILIFGALSALGATLTLPGIAGIVLTIGMAVDANVLIFERIREEVTTGKTPINAIEAGYRRALTTIVDANVTTLVAASILFFLGSGPIRGFSVTLGIGILTSVFTAVVVTRLMIALWVRKVRPSELPL